MEAKNGLLGLGDQVVPDEFLESPWSPTSSEESNDATLSTAAGKVAKYMDQPWEC